MVLLGEMQLNGDAQDGKHALELITQAASLAIPQAHTALGVIHARGLGVDINYETAFKVERVLLIRA
jgi:TPR repeat protein